MSNSDSFINEVTEEVRRDRLFALFRRYGWIAALVVVLLVGGAAWSEYQKAQARAEAEALGDAMLSALERDDPQSRAALLETTQAATPEADAIIKMMAAAEHVFAGDPEAAVEALDAISVNGDIPVIYRQIASFKALTIEGNPLPLDERRARLEGLAQPGSALRLLAEEQLALIDIGTGNRQAAIERYQSILIDAEVSSDLQQRALQVIVALGGTPELGGLTVQGN